MAMKRAFHIVLLLLALACWKGFADSGKKLEQLRAQLEQYEMDGDLGAEYSALEDEVTGAEGERLVMGLMLSVLSAGVLGIFVSVYLLPFFAHKITHAVYDSGEIVEKDRMREAHSLLAQGDYEGAIQAFQRVAEEDPMNRLPWVEIAKVYRHNLKDPVGAANILREAIEGQEWGIEDVAFLMFRLAEVHDEDMDDRTTAVSLMQQVIENFPETRHSANAAHKLRDWEHEDAEKARHAEEMDFMARQQQTQERGDSNPQA